MLTLTLGVLDAIIREKDYSPNAILPFLSQCGNFINVSVDLRPELKRLGFNGGDDELLSRFKTVLANADFDRGERSHAKKWFIDGNLPSPRFNYPFRLCFAFGLKSKPLWSFSGKRVG